MAKNIIICCDGTGNEIETDLSNVLKLYRIVEKNEKQIVFYDAGIGTISKKSIWQRRKQKIWETLCLLTGTGLDENILDAYKFLIDTYEEGDRIFLFGFSRGAYTVRVLAGFLHLVGLLDKNQKNLSEYALKAYKQVAEDSDFKIASRFKKITSARTVPIKFIGVWDTVSSVITPRRDRLLPSLQTLPFTRKNPSVEVFRHALAIDEKRIMFRANRWQEPQIYQPDRFNDPEITQNTKQVWFAGDHCDTGGGYPEIESHISKFPLKWMIEEAQNFGLQTDKKLFNHLVLGQQHQKQTTDYVAPDINGKIHDSMSFGWLIAEIVPQKVKYRNGSGYRRSFGEWYFPLVDRRLIPEESFIHNSVIERMNVDPCYRPVNIPKVYKIVE